MMVDFTMADFTMANSDSDEDDFPLDYPKFNRYSFAVVKKCGEKLLQDQLEALESLQNWFSNGDAAPAMICMPTGSGKTGIICCLPYFLGTLGLEDVPRSFPVGNPRHKFDKPVLIIAPNLNISDQLEGQILNSPEDNPSSPRNFLLRFRIIPAKRRRDIPPEGLKIEDTKQLNGTNSAIFLEGKEVVIANAQKFLAGAWEDNLPDDMFKLVIVDEAHHHPAKTWQRIIDKFRDHASVVFFTATPYRGNRELVAPKPFAYHLSLKDAIAKRIIRNTNFVEETTMEPLQLRFVQREPTPAEHQEWEIFWTILNKVKELQQRKDRDSPLPNNVPHMAFAITKTTFNADMVAELWNCFWKDAISYHSDKRSELPQLMKRIQANKVRLVVVVDMLQEGFDHPPISIAAIMTKITSPVKFVQFIGRAQRIVRGHDGHPESDKIIADIVTHLDFQQREMYSEFKQEKLLIIED